MKKENKMGIYLIIIVLASMIVGASIPMQFYDNSNYYETYQAYNLEKQYLGNIAGYENCLIMEVTPVSLYHMDTKQTEILYFANEHGVWNDGITDVIVNVKWVMDRSGNKHIEGVYNSTNLI